MEYRLIVKARSKFFFVSPVGAKLTALQDERPLELVQEQRVLTRDDGLGFIYETSTTIKREDPSKTAGTTLHHLVPPSTPYHSSLPQYGSAS